MENQILAALEIADHEVRLLVGQFFNGRLNILKVERVSHLGVDVYSIMSESLISEAIKKAVENASRNLGVLIDKVILVVPGIHMKHINKQLLIPVVGRISDNDIKRAYRDLLGTNAPEGYILSNALFTKFYVNGSSTRKIPLNEKCETLKLEVDCYYSKKNILFPYVTCVEASGLGVIDVVLDDISFAKETSAFEASIDKPVIALTLSEKLTKFSLYHQGRLLSNDYIESGFEQFMNTLKNTLKVPQDVIHRLFYYNVNLGDHKSSDDPIFLWSTKSTSHTISQKDLDDILGHDIEQFIELVCDRFSPVIALGQPKVVLSGDAAVIDGIGSLVQMKSGSETSVYKSSTFGVKDSSLTSLVGAFYYYKDQEPFRNISYTSVDEDEYKRIVLQYETKDTEDSLTKKLKHMFIGK